MLNNEIQYSLGEHLNLLVYAQNQQSHAAAESNFSMYLRYASWLQKNSSSLIGRLKIQ
jgi:hypothetical protein